MEVKRVHTNLVFSRTRGTDSIDGKPHSAPLVPKNTTKGFVAVGRDCEQGFRRRLTVHPL